MIVQLALLAMMQQTTPSPAPDKAYLFFVASEGSDEVALVRFDAKGLRVEHRTPIRLVPGESEWGGGLYTERYSGLTTDSVSGVHRTLSLSSAHGLPPEDLQVGPRYLTIAPDRRSYYVATTRGFPAGELLKVYIAGDSTSVNQSPDTLRGQEALGLSPRAPQITPDGAYAWVVNTVPGDAISSWISVIYLSSMLEVGRFRMCAGANSAQFTPDGTHHLTACSTDDALVETDVQSMKPARRVSLADARQRPCTPAAMAVVADGSRIAVSCSASSEVLVVDGHSLAVVQRIPVAADPGNLEWSADGRTLVVIHRAGHTISMIDVSGVGHPAGGSPAISPAPGLVFAADFRHAYGASTAASGITVHQIFDAGSIVVAAAFLGAPGRIDNARAIGPLAALHGVPSMVTISPDSRFAFVTFARSDAEPGVIEVIDLARHIVVGSTDFGRTLAGIAFWKTEPGR